MLNQFRKLYPQKYKIIYFLFDISLFLYFIAYMTYFEEGTFNNQIRFIATILILFFGFLLWLIKAFPVSNFSLWYTAFFAYGCASMLWADEVNRIIGVLPSMIRIIVLSLFLYARISYLIDIKIILRLYILGEVFLSIVVVKEMVQYFSISTFYLYRLGLNIKYNPNTIAITAVFANIILINSIFSETNLKKQKILDIILFVFLTIIIFLAGSKKGFIGLIFGLFAMAYFKYSGIKKIKHVSGVFIVIVIVWQLIMNVPVLYDVMGYRIDSAIHAFSSVDMADKSTQNRIGLIREAIETWEAHPILGVGLDNFSGYQDIRGGAYYSHCNYVELFADLGLIGFVLYYCFPLILYGRLSKMYNSSYIILFKTIIATIFVLDIAMVSYQEFRVQILICLAYIVFRKKIGKIEAEKINMCKI